MNKYDSPLFKTYEKIITAIAKVEWTGLKEKITGKPYNLTLGDHEILRQLLSYNYYIILTRRKTHLSTYLIQAAGLIKTGKPSFYAHALMNMEGDNPILDTEYRLMEATGKGVHYSDFMKVFDCDWVALLKPKGVTINEWTGIFDTMVKQPGKPYDNLFDLADDQRLSCVELVRRALQTLPNYDQRFSNFESLIQKKGNLVPQMFYDCPDFVVVWEARR